MAQSSKSTKKQKLLIPHIDYPLVAKPRSPMYLTHMYLTRKPPTIVGEYIEHYSKKGEIILDPFCGSGVIIAEALKLGRKAGCKVWVGQKEQGNIYDKKPLSDWCDFRHLTIPDAMPDKSDFLKQIDVLWIKEGKICHAFEVEYTTAITEAFNRCSNIPESHNAKKFIVIPEEREGLLYKKVNSELLRERVEKEGWGFIFFKDLIQFFNENKRNRSIETRELENIVKVPLEAREKQITLDKFSSVNPEWSSR